MGRSKRYRMERNRLYRENNRCNRSLLGLPKYFHLYAQREHWNTNATYLQFRLRLNLSATSDIAEIYPYSGSRGAATIVSHLNDKIILKVGSTSITSASLGAYNTWFT